MSKASPGVGLVGFVAGAVCLAGGLVSIAVVLPTMAGATIYRIDVARSMFLASLAVGVVFFAAAARLWWGALQRTGGDDLLSDQRGLLVGLMVVTTVVLVGAMVGMMLNPEFWEGAISGMRDGLRAR
ncbi:MAG TPA: hypothetical protein VF432_27335 [Thermoanaerobaculia bacterium]